MKEGEELIFSYDAKRLQISFSPEIRERGMHWRHDDYVLADLLAWLRSFNLKIQNIRDSFGIKSSVYPEKVTTKELIKVTSEVVSYQKYEDFKQQIEVLQNRYKLTTNWYLSLTSAVVFNTLLVPVDDVIHVHFPDPDLSKDNIKKSKKSKNLLSMSSGLLNSPEMRRARSAFDLYEHPSIFFTRKTSSDELKKWIDKNTHLLKAIQFGLPERKVYKRNSKTIFWGRVAWIFRQDGVRSWSKIQKLVDKECERIIEEQGEEGNKDLLNPPSNIELRKYFERFIESLQKIDIN